MLITLFLAGCVTGPAETIKPTPELVSRQFSDIAFSTEVGPQLIHLTRWRGDQTIKIALIGHTPGLAVPLKAVVNVLLNETGLDITAAAGTDDANFLLFVIPRSDFHRLKVDSIPSHTRCFFGISTDADHNITRAVIAIDALLGDEHIRHCIAEEFIQAMGLRDDACDYRPSLFCDDDQIAAPTNADRLLLAVLYDPALQPGMSKEIAMPIARRLIRVRWGEYMSK